MKLPNPFQWWRRSSRRRRIAIIACLLLILAGSEMAVYLTPILDVAVLIDAFGIAFLLSSAASCLPIPLRSIWESVGMIARQTYGLTLERIAEAGLALRWLGEAVSYRAVSIEHKITWGKILLVHGGGITVLICLSSTHVHIFVRALRQLV